MSRAERLAEKLLQDRELAKQREAARRASRREPAGLDNFDPFEPANWVAIAGSDPGYLPTIPMRKGPVGWHVACRASPTGRPPLDAALKFTGARYMKFTLDSFDDPEQLLTAAARLTLRLVPRCEWEGCTPKDDDDPDSWQSLYDRISDLMGAYAHSSEGKGQPPAFLMARFAATVADVIAKVPSLQAAVAADLAAKQDNDP